MNKKRKKIVIKVFMILCIVLMIYSIINIISWYIDGRRNESIQEEIHEIIEESIQEDEEEPKIDFSKLREKNSDIVAYLKVNNTKIDYLVVKGNDNKYYLNHNLYKESSRHGWIFMDYHNNLDNNDKNIIIYGHNTKDGSMFGTLRKIVNKDWYRNQDNHYIDLVLDNQSLHYQVFSTYSIKVEDYYINTEFRNNEEFNKFVKTLKKRSVYNYNVDVNGDDQILTLSTCTGNGKSRMVLHAKLIENNLED